ncbi:MAG: glycoside hydrolase family 1 protein [Oligoflexales bacterium]|nr:glycoside hydrolase family 1 protein [Oligoflexales bacterium]
MKIGKGTSVRYNLPKNFLIGASASGWQTEGWTGKKDHQISFMDAAYKFAPERWHEGYGPSVATDFYNRYKEDCALMKTIGIRTYRTSIDWSRFLKNYETCEVDEDAARYYNNVIDELIKNNVEPMVCLEHWELPISLYEKYGGWGSKHVVDLFVKYAERVFDLLGSKVKFWFTFNEPIVIPMLGIMEAHWYPYKADTKEAMQWNYNKVLATAKCVELFHRKGYGKSIDARIGVILNSSPVYPRSDDIGDQRAAEMCDLFHNRLYLDPVIKGTFPTEYFPLLKRHSCMVNSTESELAIINANRIDLLGYNYYAPLRVQARTAAWNPEVKFNPRYYYDLYDLPGRKMNPSRGWEIYGKGLYDFAMRIRNDYYNIPWIVMENGMGVTEEAKFKDQSGVIQDDYRIDFVCDHLRWLLKAIDEGSSCLGYLMWNFTDNVSPYNAFRNRYGFVEIDLKEDRKRRIKKSGHWLQKVTKEGYFEYDSLTPEYR